MNAAAFLIPEWPVPARVRALATTRGGAGTGVSSAPFDHFNLGAHCGDDADAVARNRATLRELGGLPGEPMWLRQVHGTCVVRWGRPHPNLPPQAGEGEWTAPLLPLPPRAGGEEARLRSGGSRAEERPSAVREGRDGWDGGLPDADAAVTSDPDIVLAILTADCLPVLFCAADGNEIGAAHAGWRGLAAGVLERTVAAMHTPASALIAWLGPAAGPQAYEIGEEVHAAFVERDPRACAAFVPTRPGHWRVDLYALARQRLADAGVTHVHGGGLCTISDPQRFFSHRRDGRSGRMATLVWIEAD